MQLVYLWIHLPPNKVCQEASRFANPVNYKSSVFPQIMRDRNSLTDSLISTAEDGEDFVATIRLLSLL